MKISKVENNLYNITVLKLGHTEDMLFDLPHYPYADEDKFHGIKADELEELIAEHYNVPEVRLMSCVKVKEIVTL